ncbi:hypothetical protein V7O62_01530 [Methanolobus sp. ZRKC2]|uniref:hypothetical protein n=1 Tax=Methanolobus sp. ZRKC2 TaxID=3125783 RepID=UPI003250D8C7
MVVKRNKEKTSIALSSYLLGRAKKLVEANEFGSVSDVMSTAFSQFLLKYDLEHQETSVSGDIREAFATYGTTEECDFVQEIIADYLKSQEGKALIKSIIRESLSPSSGKDAPVMEEDIIE